MALLWQAAAAQNGGNGNVYSYVHAQEDRVSLTFLYLSTQQLWVAHGYLMIISFVFLIPLAIAASMLRFMLPGACWFTLHTFLSWLAFLMISTGFGIAVYIVSQDFLGPFRKTLVSWLRCLTRISGIDPSNQIQKEADFPHFSLDDMHRSVGLAVFLLMTVQVFLAYFRPPLPAPYQHVEDNASVSDTDDEAHYSAAGDDGDATKSVATTAAGNLQKPKYMPADKDFAPSPPKSAARLAWEVLHRIFGFGILGVAWYQCSTGLDKYEQDTGTSLFPNAERFMWLVVGGFGGVVVILFYIQTTCRR